MKKIFVLLMAFVLLMSVSGCGKNVSPQIGAEKKPLQSAQGIVGTWQVKKADYELSADPMKSVLSSLLKEYIKKGSDITFAEDNKGMAGEAEITYSFSGNTLIMTWDNSKNFTFEVSFDDGRLELEIDDVAEFELERK